MAAAAAACIIAVVGVVVVGAVVSTSTDVIYAFRIADMEMECCVRV